MRKLDYFVCALGCSLSALPMSCSSKSGNGVEGGSTGGAAFKNTGGAQYQGAGGNYVPPSSTSNPNAGGTTSAGTETSCAQQEVPIKTLPPDIMIIMDRSLSMTDDVTGQACAGGNMSGNGNCGDRSKWAQTIAAVKDVVNTTQGNVNWGLFFLGAELSQCGAATAPVVGITSGNSYDPIAASLDGEQFTGQIGTPTTAVVKNAVAYLQALTDQNPKFLLLATDGEPNCANGSVNANDATGATNAIKNAKSLGIPTFVVGIATTTVASATTALNSAAAAGGYPLTGTTQYYAVSDTQALSDALKQIVGLAASCTISLSNTPVGQDWSIAITATDTSGATVVIDPDANNGWGYTDSNKTAITLVGTACDNLKTGAFTDIKFVYTCKGHEFIF
jgi:hypothetical protein